MTAHPTRSARRTVFAAVLAIAPNATFAQPTKLSLELNRLEPREGSCRVWMVATNPEPAALDPLRLDLVLFGRDGIAARRLAVDVGPLPGGRTVVRLFDVQGQPCGDVGQVLLNDVLACGAVDAAARAACADRISTGSRVPGVGFNK